MGGKRGLGLVLLVFCALSMMGFPTFAEVLFKKDSVVRQQCSACHKPDAQGRLEVIEETRKTPEEWKIVVDRMIRLHDAQVAEQHFNTVIKELSLRLSLSPKEMAVISYINSDENNQYRETPKNDLEKRLYVACVRCHTWGKMASHRNTRDQWQEMRNLHLGLYPTAVLQMREMNWPKEFQDLIQPLSKLFPFETPEWRNWLKERTIPNLAGKWKIAGYQPGFGYYIGSYQFKPDPSRGADEYTITKEIRFLNGQTRKFDGTGTLYSGFHLRYALKNSSAQASLEGVFDLKAEEMKFSGKWWDVVQDKNAFGNEAFIKESGPAGVLAVFPLSLRKGSGKAETLNIIVNKMGGQLSAADIKFSNAAIQAEKVVQTGDSGFTVTIKVGEDAAVGPVRLTVKGVAYRSPITVYDKIDGIRVFPAIGRARVSSGPAYPPQGVQFVARAVHFGKDGDENTADDLILEPVDAKWLLEEEDTSVSTLMKGLRLVGIYPKFGREVDDDLKYLKAPVDNGLYTPVTTYAPIKERPQHVQGTGLIAITASATIDGEEYKGRSRLAVTVPDFIPQLK